MVVEVVDDDDNKGEEESAESAEAVWQELQWPDEAQGPCC